MSHGVAVGGGGAGSGGCCGGGGGCAGGRVVVGGRASACCCYRVLAAVVVVSATVVVLVAAVLLVLVVAVAAGGGGGNGCRGGRGAAGVLQQEDMHRTCRWLLGRPRELPRHPPRHPQNPPKTHPTALSISWQGQSTTGGPGKQGVHQEIAGHTSSASCCFRSRLSLPVSKTGDVYLHKKTGQENMYTYFPPWLFYVSIFFPSRSTRKNMYT